MCSATRDRVCVMNSPRSFFSFEKESNLLRRDFLRLRISVRKRERKSHQGRSRLCEHLVYIFKCVSSLLSNSNCPHHDPFFPFPSLSLIIFSPECSYLFLRSKNRAGHFNRRDLVVCLNSPLLNGCTAPDTKDKWIMVCVCMLVLYARGCLRLKSRERSIKCTILKSVTASHDFPQQNGSFAGKIA